MTRVTSVSSKSSLISSISITISYETPKRGGENSRRRRRKRKMKWRIKMRTRNCSKKEGKEVEGVKGKEVDGGKRKRGGR